MKSKILMLITLCFIGIGTALGQTINIKGVVVDENNTPVIGATVRLKSDATVGAATGLDGDFTLRAKQGELIIISYVGYVTQEVPAAANMNIKLVPDSEMLDEVMVVAYGTAKKESFTGSAAVVDSKQLGKMQAPDAMKALEGMVPGLQISTGSGAPGAGSTIRVRGIGSINAGAAPLVILDGAPYDGNINSINPRDIASLSVLKDAASAALYGARGANGVIIITTRTGRAGQLQIELDARYGVNQRGVPEYDIIKDPGTFYETFWDAKRNAYHFGGAGDPLDIAANKATQNLIIDPNGVGLGYNVYNVASDKVVLNDGKLNPAASILYEDAGSFNDWGSLLMSPKPRQEYNLSLTKGSDSGSTYFSIGYLNDQGYAIKTGFERLTSRLSYNTQLKDWMKFSAGSQFSYTTGNFGNASSAAFSNIFMFTRNIAPIYPLYLHDTNGKIIKDSEGNNEYDLGYAREGINSGRLFSAGKNIVGETELNKDQYRRYYLTQNARLDLDLTHGFKFNTSFTYYYNNASSEYLINSVMGDGAGYGGILEKTNNTYQTINWNQILTWDGKFDDFNIQAMLGHESYSWSRDYLYAEKRNTIDPTSIDLVTYAQMTGLNSYRQNYAVEGYFAQLVADYLEKYYFSASLRADASSIFAPKERWGSFWSLGASWLINKEDFLKDVNWINNLKLRTSIGQQGNDNLLDDSGYRVYSPYSNLYSVGSDGTNHTFSPVYMGNPLISWEKSTNYSVGLEFSGFNRALDVEVDYFSRLTTDLLFNEPVSKTTGFTYQPQNLGKMVNRGFEFNIVARPYTSQNVNITLGLNGTTYVNEILELPERFKEDGMNVSGSRIMKEGGGIYDLYLVKYKGVNPENGDAQYEVFNDTDKVFETVPSSEYRAEMRDRQFVGSAIPDLEGGFYGNFNFYGVDLGLQFSYRIGGKIYDNGYAGLMHAGSDNGNNWHSDIQNRWTPTNTNTDIPRVQLSSQKLISTSDRFLTDASYLSLRNITLGYTLPQSWIESIGVNNLRVYFVADNVLLLSKRQGLDPRSSITGASVGPVASVIRTISGGVTISF